MTPEQPDNVNGISGGLALIYTRVSSPGQVRGGEGEPSFDVQEEACRALAARRGYTVARVVHEVYRGWELFDRPELTQVRADLRAGRYAALLCYTTSRLARDPVHQAIIIEEAMRGGAIVDFVNEPLDTSPEGLLIAYVRGYAAQIDIARLRAQLMGGRRKRVENGKLGNAGVDLYGYRRDREAGVRVIRPDEAPIVERIYRLCAYDHLGQRRIARLLDSEGVAPPSVGKLTRRPDEPPARWSNAQVRNILRNPAYRGETLVWRWRSELIPSSQAQRPAHSRWQDRPRRTQYRSRPRPLEDALRLPDGVTPAIVSEELWQAAQDALESRVAQALARPTKFPYLLRGLIRCGVCGRSMEARTDHINQAKATYIRTYRCASGQSMDGPCGGSRIRADAIESWVWSQVLALLADPDILLREAEAGAQAQTGAADDAGALAREHEQAAAALARVERLQARTLARYNTVDDEAVLPWSLVQAELARLDTERQRHVARLAELDAAQRSQRQAVERAASLAERISHLRAGVEAATDADRRAYLDSLHVRITGNGVEWRMLLELVSSDSTHGVFTLMRSHPEN